MILGAAVVPSAPLLVRGVSATLPAPVSLVRDAVDAALAALPAADVTVLLAVGSAGVHDTATASLAGIGRPDLLATVPVDAAAASAIAAATGWPRVVAEPLPLGLTVLALLTGAPCVVPVAVPADAPFDVLAGAGAALAGAGVRATVVAAGDLSSGLTERSPRYRIDGAQAWDERAVAAVAAGDGDGLAQLGPVEARRVGALGWAPLAVLHGAATRAGLAMAVRTYAAPRGVGYLVAAATPAPVAAPAKPATPAAGA